MALPDLRYERGFGARSVKPAAQCYEVKLSLPYLQPFAINPSRVRHVQMRGMRRNNVNKIGK
jgi:hypothetical protein